MLSYALAVFVGAFLLFQVQPLIGKYVLPWFGGGPEVWTTCMLFFQTMLLVGYTYAHLSVRFLKPRTQGLLHVALLLAALTVLPIAPDPKWASAGGAGENPTLGILLLLAATIGLPFLVLSATSPLLQSWSTRTLKGYRPYRLYALSNAGSLLALMSYPFLVEPILSRNYQVIGWSCGMAMFAVISILCAIKLWKVVKTEPPRLPAENPKPQRSSSPTLTRRLLWLVLPAGASVVLLAVTNKITLDLAAVPFLWVGPLSLYLLSFIICFDNERWYPRRAFVAAFIICILAVIFLRTNEADIAIWVQTVLYLLTLFICCMVCHGELFRLRPDPQHLTSYYLTIAAGGALGGFFVAVIAPLLFKTYLELYLGLLVCCLLALLVDPSSAVRRRRWVWITFTVVGIVAVVLQPSRGTAGEKLTSQSRNFYGVLTVWEKYSDDPEQHRYVMQHGTTFHGLQFTDRKKRTAPTAYYGPDSGGGLTMRLFPRKTNRRIGVVGLGVGTLATYGNQGDVIKFYEINPAVKRLAETRFTYLSDSLAGIEVIMGDARLSLERQPPQQFDILLVDAFNSDAIPVHLLTKEAFEIYLKHLKPDGVLGLHISNYHLDLKGVIFRLGAHFNLQTLLIRSPKDELKGLLTSDWVLLTNNREFLATKQIQMADFKSDAEPFGGRLWTDEHVSLLEVLK